MADLVSGPAPLPHLRRRQFQPDREMITTSGRIAVANLNAQVHTLTTMLHSARSGQERSAPLPVSAAAPLVDLLLLRGQVLGRIGDHERAAGLAAALVRDAPHDSAAWLARARTHATFHRFPEALADLDAAERQGADRTVLGAERAASLQGIGCHAEARAMVQDAAGRRPDFTTLGASAVLHAEHREITEAERRFSEARARYRGVSPFPVAELDFRRGVMWLGERDLPAARLWFDAVIRRVPAHARALGYHAEVDAGLGARRAAIARLRALVLRSDDPAYTGRLAALLRDADRPLEAERWRRVTADRYDELVARHPEAFADHAADYWLTVGGDLQRWLPLARLHRENRRAAREWAAQHPLGRAG